MLRKIAFLVLFFLTCVPQLLFGQGKIHRELMLWPEMQLDFVMRNKSFFYFRNQYRINTDSDLERLERTQFQIGYEHMFNENWSGGLSERYAMEEFQDRFFSEVFLRHKGHIGPLQFVKWGDFEYITSDKLDATSRFRLRASLDKRFEAKTIGIRPRVAYEILFLSGLTGENPANQRRVDRTRLRLDVGFEVSPHFSVTPYFMKQTNYIVTLEQYTFDENGNKVITDPGGNHNVILPIIGLDIRFTLYKGQHEGHRPPPLVN